MDSTHVELREERLLPTELRVVRECAHVVLLMKLANDNLLVSIPGASATSADSKGTARSEIIALSYRLLFPCTAHLSWAHARVSLAQFLARNRCVARWLPGHKAFC